MAKAFSWLRPAASLAEEPPHELAIRKIVNVAFQGESSLRVRFLPDVRESQVLADCLGIRESGFGPVERCHRFGDSPGASQRFTQVDIGRRAGNSRFLGFLEQAYGFRIVIRMIPGHRLSSEGRQN